MHRSPGSRSAYVGVAASHLREFCRLGRIRPLLRLRCQRRQSPVRRIDNQRCPSGADYRGSPVEPELVVVANDVRGLLDIERTDFSEPSLFEFSGLRGCQKRFIRQLSGSFQRGQRAEVPDALQIRGAPCCAGRRGGLASESGRHDQYRRNHHGHDTHRRKKSIAHSNLLTNWLLSPPMVFFLCGRGIERVRETCVGNALPLRFRSCLISLEERTLPLLCPPGSLPECRIRRMAPNRLLPLRPHSPRTDNRNRESARTQIVSLSDRPRRRYRHELRATLQTPVACHVSAQYARNPEARAGTQMAWLAVRAAGSPSRSTPGNRRLRP